MQLKNVTCKTVPISRTGGKSAVAAAAYRSGEKLRDDRMERTYNYQGRENDVRLTEILLPEGADRLEADCSDRNELWNFADSHERRKDSRVARDNQLGLAWELSPEKQHELVREWANREFVSKGHIADIAIHNYGARVTDKSAEGQLKIENWQQSGLPFHEQDDCNGLYSPHVKIERKNGTIVGYKIYQPHAHVLVTTRPVDGERLNKAKNTQHDKHAQAKDWRYQWAELQNKYLKQEGHNVRVTSVANDNDRNVFDIQTNLKPETIRSPSAYHMEQKGEQTIARERVELNKVHNQAMKVAQDSFNDFKKLSPEDQKAENDNRVSRWWTNAHAHLDGWREQFKEQAEHWQGKFHATRAKILDFWDREQTQKPPDQDIEPEV